MSKVELTAAQKAREFTRTHFSLGDYTYNGFGTEMKGKYQKHSENEENSGRTRLTQQKNNFKLGNLDNQFKTTSSKHYTAKDLNTDNALPAWKLQDLKSHHINYGEYGNQNRTEQQVSFNQKDSQNSGQQQERQQQQQRMRRHHHDFKEDSHARYLSQYQQSNQLDPTQQQQSMLDHQQLARNQQIKATTKTNSNILLGQHFLPPKSFQQSDYLEKEHTAVVVPHDYSKTNYNLGEHKSDFSTTNGLYFNRQAIAQHQLHQLSKEQRQGLRESHFQLGGDQRLAALSEQQLQYLSEHHQNQQQPQQCPNQQHTNHFQLGNDKPLLNTHYSKNMQDYSQQIQAGEVLRPTAKRDSSLQVGAMPNQYHSENNRNYQYDPNNLIKNEISPHQKQELYISHVKFNDVANNNYATNQQKDYITHNAPPNVLPKEQLANLKGTHFTLGGHSSKFVSTNQQTFQKQDNSEARGEQKQSNKSNWKLG